MRIEKNNELFKNTLVLGIGQIIPKFISIMVLPILTAYLVKREFGLLELNLTVASFCIPLISIQIQQAVFRFLIDEKSDKKQIATTSFLFVLMMLALTWIPIIDFWIYYDDNLFLAACFAASYAAELLLGWIGQISRGLGDNISYSLAYIIYSVGYISLLIFKVSIDHKLELSYVVISMCFAYSISFIYLLVRKKIYQLISFKNYKTTMLKKMLMYSAPMVISSVALWAVNLSDRFFVSGFLGLEATAFYAVTNKVPNLFNSLYNIFNLAWTENASKISKGEKDSGYYSVFFYDFFNLMIGLIMSLVAVSPLIYKILINNQYAEGYYLMPWLFVGVFFSSLVSFFGSIYVGEMKTSKVGISSAIGAVINIFINFLLMKQYGIIVAAVSTIISYFIILIYRAIDIRKYVELNYDFKQISIGLLFFLVTVIVNSKNTYITLLLSVILAIIFNYKFNRSFFVKILDTLGRKIRNTRQ